MMVDEGEHPKGQLEKGQYKALQTDRVRLRHGSTEEAAVIRCIFDRFVNARKSYSEIRRALNEANIANHNGRPWTDGMIPTILGNENYIGKTVYNRTSRRLGERLVKNLLMSGFTVPLRLKPSLIRISSRALKNCSPSGASRFRKTRC